MLKVIIDYDDVLNDCNQAAIEKLNKEEGTRFLLSDIHKWGITRTLLDKRIEYFKDPLFMSTVPLRKGAKKFIKQLSKRMRYLSQPVCIQIVRESESMRSFMNSLASALKIY